MIIYINDPDFTDVTIAEEVQQIEIIDFDQADGMVSLSIITAAGDMIYGSGAGVAAVKHIGTAGQVWIVGGDGLPAWTTLAGGGVDLLQVHVFS